MRLLPVILLSVAMVPALADGPTVDQIMARVAENQARTQEMRRAYVYNQKILARFHRTNGKLAREEKFEYLVTPAPTGIEKKLTHFEGSVQRGSRLVSYSDPDKEIKDLDIDGDLMRDMINEMTGDKDSKDGIAHDLFPLTAAEQAKYIFILEGQENYHGRQVYRVSFHPKPHTEEADWKGDALIDAAECQPVIVTSEFATRIPMAVKVLLGTDIKGLGFTVTYQKFDDGLWFPVSYGGEFHIRAVFFYARNMSISMVNSGFTRAKVSSKIAYDMSEQ
ncbi:MAG TPA: hypothetical protein VMR62_01985 [Bryobacteraceae bacterium]|jgi:hypothetical protein|nr:hypothetical protein [Bryobacteraceae bacterium]